MHNFSKLILHALILLLFVVLLLFGTIMPYFYGEEYYYQDYNVRKSLSGELDTLIVGSSHALRSVKPTVLNKELNVKSYNLASPLMSMYGRYVLLEKEVKRNPIKTVFFELSYNALTLDRADLGYEGDLYVLGRLDNDLERLKFAKEAFATDEYKNVFSDTIRRSGNSLKGELKNAIMSAKNGFKKGPSKLVQYETYGYLEVPSNDYSLSLEQKKQILNTGSISAKMNDESLKYFDDIIGMCKDNNIRVVLIVIPVTEYVILQNENMDDLFSQYAELAKKYDCEYYDFNLDKKRNILYSEKTSFFDTIHMSDEGAETFSKRLSEIIKEVDEGEDCSSEFYETYNEVKESILKAE